MLQLWVLDGDPLLDFLATLVDPLDLLDLVHLRHWLERLLGSCQLLVLLNDCISRLQSSQLIVNLLLWERESADHLKDRLDCLRVNAQLAESDVLETSIAGHHLRQSADSLGSRQLSVTRHVKHPNTRVVGQLTAHGLQIGVRDPARPSE